MVNVFLSGKIIVFLHVWLPHLVTFDASLLVSVRMSRRDKDRNLFCDALQTIRPRSKLIAGYVTYIRQRESGEGLWLQEEAAFLMHSFRDAEPQQMIPPNAKKHYGMSLSSPHQSYILA